MNNSISLSQQEMVDELRNRLRLEGVLSGKYDTDFNLLRWLQGYQFDLEKAFPKLRHHLRFRRAWNLDSILESDQSDFKVMKYLFGYIGGSTKKDNNYIVSVENVGLPDFPGIVRSFSQYEVAQATAFLLESMLDVVMKQEADTNCQSGVVFILDLQGLKFDTEMLRILSGPFKSLCKFMADHYVELFAQICVVNVPWFMFNLWKIVQSFVAELTANKITFLSSDWKQKILDYVDADALPRQWGGSLDDSIRRPTPIPKELYWTDANRDEHVYKVDELKQLHIPGRKNEILTFRVDTVGQILSWNSLQSSDAAFGVFFSENGNEEDLEKMEMVFPQFLFIHGPSHVPFYQLQVECRKLGFYKFWFSNPAWLVKLKIWIVIKTIQP